jgi:eukaryotic-like serine/threonine-protein kinase
MAENKDGCKKFSKPTRLFALRWLNSDHRFPVACLVSGSMIAIPIADFLEQLANPRLLNPKRFAELNESWLQRCDEPKIIAMELVHRRWLTPYQVQLLLEGEGKSLFLGSYVILEPLAEGGMGSVFLARHAIFDHRRVAIKVIRRSLAEDRSMVTRFNREIRALAKLDHPNVVRVFDADIDAGRIFHVTEYIEGVDLDWYIHRHGPMEEGLALHCIRQIAEALHYAHKNNLVHRDLKPSNIILETHTGTAKLLDLGLTRSSRPVNDSVFRDMTGKGVLIGTPDYVAPEQIVDSANVDIRADLYSLGCCLYTLLTGRGPFAHLDSAVAKLQAHVGRRPQPVRTLRPALSAISERLIAKLMAKSPDDRYANPAELLSELRNPAMMMSRPVEKTMFDTIDDCSLKTLNENEPIRLAPKTHVVPRELMDQIAERNYIQEVGSSVLPLAEPISEVGLTPQGRDLTHLVRPLLLGLLAGTAVFIGRAFGLFN